jgi:DNA-binding NarL/FixJ family response regulator
LERPGGGPVVSAGPHWPSVVVVGGEPLVVSAVCALLEEAEFNTTPASPLEALTHAAAERPEIVLVVAGPGLNLALIEGLRRAVSHATIAVLGNQDSRPNPRRALDAGADAWIDEKLNPRDLPVLVRSIRKGAIVTQAPTAGAATGLDRLSPRERTILQAAARGLTNGEIARELWVTEQTVKFHLTNIYRKLGVPNRTQAARYAFEHGLLAVLDESE